MVHWGRVEGWISKSKWCTHTHTHARVITDICAFPGSSLSSLLSRIHAALIWVLKFEALQLSNESRLFLSALCAGGEVQWMWGCILYEIMGNYGGHEQKEAGQSERWALAAAVVNRGRMNPSWDVSCKENEWWSAAASLARLRNIRKYLLHPEMNI